MLHAASWKWFHYYWQFCKHFGMECYRTWRWELFASVIVVLFVAVISNNWKDFRTALFATGLTLGVFAVWHLLRVPFLLHQSVHKGGDTSEPGRLAGVFGMVIILGGFSGGYELCLWLWNAKPIGVITAQFASADPGAKNARIAELERHCASRPSTSADNRRASLDLRCQNLSDCPTGELAKRAKELIAELETVVSPYHKYREQWNAEAEAVQRGVLKVDNFNETMRSNLKAESRIVMWKYQHEHHIDVIAMRAALIKRVGHQDSSEDYEYQSAGTEVGDPFDIDRIIADLRKLTGEVLAMRQHE